MTMTPSCLIFREDIHTQCFLAKQHTPESGGGEGNILISRQNTVSLFCFRLFSGGLETWN